MSFSSDVKEELSARLDSARHCQIAEFAALMGMSGRIRRSSGGEMQVEMLTENEVGDKISADEKAQVQADIDALKALVEKTDAENVSEADVAELKAANEKLMQSAQNVFQKMYEGAQAAGAGPDMGAGAGPDMGAGAADNGADDDVVDGEYREV